MTRTNNWSRILAWEELHYKNLANFFTKAEQGLQYTLNNSRFLVVNYFFLDKIEISFWAGPKRGIRALVCLDQSAVLAMPIRPCAHSTSTYILSECNNESVCTSEYEGQRVPKAGWKGWKDGIGLRLVVKAICILHEAEWTHAHTWTCHCRPCIVMRWR